MKKLMVLLAVSSLMACTENKNEPYKHDPNARELIPHPEGAAKDDMRNAAQKAYAKANDKMHAGMGRINADADIAFVEGMIPHHQGAIDMAEIVLKHGKDAENKKLAKAIIAAQEKEIAEMKAWLAAKGRPYKAVEASTDHSAMGH